MGKISLTWKGKELSSKLMGVQFLDVRVSRKYKTPEQPLEDGTPIIDHKVRMPIEVSVSCCVRSAFDIDIDTVMTEFDDMCDAKLGTSNIAEVTDKTGRTYSNLVLIDYGHVDNNTDKFDNYYFELKFKEVMFMGGQSVKKAANSENSDTQDV